MRGEGEGYAMSDPHGQAPDQDGPVIDATSEEIAKSLGSVWQRFSGQRPKSTSVEIDKDRVVRCVIEEGAPDPEAEPDNAAGDPRVVPNSGAYKHDTTAAVARVTGRNVVAFIPQRDEKAEVSTHTFILDQPGRKF